MASSSALVQDHQVEYRAIKLAMHRTLSRGARGMIIFAALEARGVDHG
jgi:hypothetical protein